MANFTLEEDDFISEINIKVIGVGGGGGNALNKMVEEGIKDVQFIAVNTDVRALKNSRADVRVQIGQKLTRGRGAGNKPVIGAQSAEENHEELVDALRGANMVFVSAGMGGGTGTGAAPVVAQIAKDMDILTVAVVTKPFDFEQKAKMEQAELGIAELRKHVDSLVVIPNQKLLSTVDKAPTMMDCFKMADDILKTGVKSIAELITRDGLINVDFADVETTMKNAGIAHMAVGHGSGKDKANEAANAVITSPLLETSIKGAKRLLVNVVMSPDTLSTDMESVANAISGAADDTVQTIFGAAFDENLKDEMLVTAIACEFPDYDEIASGVTKISGGEDSDTDDDENTEASDLTPDYMADFKDLLGMFNK
jgi:cell division protein FtsZ